MPGYKKFKYASKKRNSNRLSTRKFSFRRKLSKYSRRTVRNSRKGATYSGEEEIRLENINLGADYTRKIYRFDQTEFPRLSAISPAWQWIKIKKATIMFRSQQTQSYWYNQQPVSGEVPLAVTYLNMDGTDTEALTMESALLRPYAKTHDITKTFTRTYYPQIIKQLHVQSGVATYANVLKHENPWLAVGQSLNIDRIGPGVFIPQVLPPSGEDARTRFEVYMKIEYDLKGIRAGL